MKKIGLSMSLLAALALFNCASIDKTSVNGKEVVTATRAAPVILTAIGAPVTDCLDDLNKEGVSTVTNANGAPTKGLFSVSRLTGSENCQATGVK
ncbi:MAG: hypothetical protein KDK23_14920 [Leptospiraceae bacterium]|nr:hypothetical protein [Leptospiraceae bacterium]